MALRYVNTASSAGGDGTTNATSGATRAYASLNAWEAARQADLVTAADGEEVQCCGTAADTTRVDIDGWTTSATYYIRIRGNPTDGAGRHPGYRSTSHYRLSASADGFLAVLNINEDYTRVEWIQVEQSGTSPVPAVIRGNDVSRVGLWLESVLAHSTNTNSQGGIYLGTAAAGTSHVVNCAVTGSYHSTAGVGIYLRSVDYDVFAINCSVHITGAVCYKARDGGGVRVYLYNCVGTNATTIFEESQGTFGGSHVAYDAGADPLTSGVDLSAYSDAQIYNDAANGDLRLAAGSPLIDVGIDRSLASSGRFITDIVGNVRRYTWDIGAHEYGADTTAILTRYVNTASSAGGDGTNNTTSGAYRAYASLSAWEAARQDDLTTLGYVSEVLCCGSTADSTAVTVDGWTTSATYYIHIRGNPNHANGAHFGASFNTSRYRLTASSEFGPALDVREPYTRLTQLQVQNTSLDGSYGIRCFPNVSAANSVMYLDGIISYYQRSSSGNASGIMCFDGTYHLRNCISVRNAGRGICLEMGDQFSLTGTVDNCIAANNGGQGFVCVHSGISSTLRNCYAGGNTGADISTLWDTITTCRTEDGSQSTTTAAFSTSAGCYFTNVTPGSEDFAIASASSALIDAGTDLSLDTYRFITDILGNIRRYTWDIGAHEYGADATSVLTRYVNTASSAGGDGTSNGTSGAYRAYASLSAWEAARQQDFALLPDHVEEALCCGSTADTTAVSIDGWSNQTSARYVHVKGNEGHANGRSFLARWSTSHYRLVVDVAFWYPFEINETYTRVTGIQVQNTGNDGDGVIRIASGVNSGGNDDCRLEAVFAYSLASEYSGSGFVQVASRVKYRNCIAVCSWTGGGSGFANNYSGPGAAESYWDNCVSVGAQNGFYNGSFDNTTHARNCYAGGTGTADYAGSDFTAITTSRSEDGTKSTTTAAYSTSAGCYFTNVTAGSEDFAIGASSALIDVGTDLSSSFTTDIANVTRPTGANTWDIGVWEFVAGGPTTFPHYYYAQQQ